MSLSDFCIKRPVFAAVLSLLIVVLGVASLLRLPIRELPDVDAPIISVSTAYTGAAPEIVDTDITAPIEGVIAGIAGVKTVTSTSQRGGARTVIEFEPGRNIDEAANDVRDAVARVRTKLPDEVDEIYQRFDVLGIEANGLADETREGIDTRLRNVGRQAAATQEWLLWAVMALVPAAMAVAAIFAFFVLRPLRAIDRAISDLGRGAFSQAIAISGPADLSALGRQLEWLRTRLLDIALERNRFLRHMSHELKTPLANIREGTDLLLDGAVGPIDENQREVASILRENALRLQQLIENLLSYSAWKSRASSVELTSFRLSSLVGTVVDSQRLAMAARNLTLDLHVADLHLVADRPKLKLVLENLLSNALKFTPRGGTIHLHAYPDGATTVIDFADTGPGIAPDECDKVFDAFYSGTTPQGGPLKGTGIGLSVVREFVEAHGGTVEIVTGAYPGAHLRIRLPAALRRESAHAA